MLSSDFMKILEGTDYSFLRENSHLANKIMLLGLSGSYGYGTNREGSDMKFRGVAMDDFCNMRTCTADKPRYTDCSFQMDIRSNTHFPEPC